MNKADATSTINPPLSTRDSQIVDSKNQPVLLRGVNWFGIESEIHAPHGLWKRDYKDMLAQIKSLGYNAIRLPYSVQSLRSDKVSGIDFSLGSNKDLEGKTPLEVMDRIVQEAEQQGILILLDSHRLNDQRIPELWYGDGFTEADWIDTWKMLATRYKNQLNVIGADLKNEPHGQASWGTNNPETDWRLAAERAGNAILAINPNWLIVVEGVEKNVPGQKLSGHWQGGNLEGVKRDPVRLSVANKLVYSPHEYGPGVYDQPWFSDPTFPKNLYYRWETGFHYIATQKIAPILIGEFGGHQVDSNSKEGIWQQQLVDYIAKENLSFTYWSWNPNSADTGGILQDDWQSVNAAKQQMLARLLPVNSSIPNASETPTPKPSLIPQPSPSITPIPSSSKANLKAESALQTDWETGFCVNMRVTNQGNTSIENWRLTFQMNQAAINNTWNGSFLPQGSQYVVTPAEWGRTLQPNQTLDLGFCANKLGSDYQPKQVSASSL
ncbi:MAG: cellulase family glycosylhydrolase [Cyanobacteriota bacterium]